MNKQQITVFLLTYTSMRPIMKTFEGPCIFCKKCFLWKVSTCISNKIIWTTEQAHVRPYCIFQILNFVTQKIREIKHFHLILSIWHNITGCFFRQIVATVSDSLLINKIEHFLERFAAREQRASGLVSKNATF